MDVTLHELEGLSSGVIRSHLYFKRTTHSPIVSFFFKRGLMIKEWAFLVAQLVKNMPAMQETPVQFLGREDPLEKG